MKKLLICSCMKHVEVGVHGPSGVNGSILICSVRIFLVLNTSHVSDKLLRPECFLGNQNQDLYIQYMYCMSSNL